MQLSFGFVARISSKIQSYVLSRMIWETTCNHDVHFLKYKEIVRDKPSHIFTKKTYLIFVCTLPRKQQFLTLGKVTETWIIFFENDPRLYDFVWLFALKGPIFCLWIGRKEDNYNLFAGYKIAMVLLGTMLFPWKLYRFTVIPFVSFHGKQRFQDIIWFPRNWATPKKLEPYPIILVDYRDPNS